MAVRKIVMTDSLRRRLLRGKFLAGDGCWEWTASRFRNGYGQFNSQLAHRVIYKELVGPIPEGLDLDHLCRNRACVRPDHLEPVTRRENLIRGETSIAENVRKTHCKHGHEFTEKNIYRWRGKRLCRICRDARRHKNRGKVLV